MRTLRYKYNMQCVCVCVCVYIYIYIYIYNLIRNKVADPILKSKKRLVSTNLIIVIAVLSGFSSKWKKKLKGNLVWSFNEHFLCVIDRNLTLSQISQTKMNFPFVNLAKLTSAAWQISLINVCWCQSTHWLPICNHLASIFSAICSLFPLVRTKWKRHSYYHENVGLGEYDLPNIIE